MDFDNEVLEALVHLDHAPTPPTIVKISPILPSSRSSPPASHASGGSNDSSNEDMASYNGDSNCHSDEDEYALFRNSFRTDQSTLNNAPPQRRLQKLEQRHCLAYYLKTLRINFSATNTLATNDSSFGPSYATFARVRGFLFSCPCLAMRLHGCSF